MLFIELLQISMDECG